MGEDLKVLSFSFNNKDEFHKTIISKPDFLKTIVNIDQSSGNTLTNFNREKLYEFLHSSFKQGGSVFLLYSGSNPIGFALGYNNKLVQKEFVLSFVAIKKEHQQKGFGEFFLKKTYLELEKLGYTQISMFENNIALSKINKKIVEIKKRDPKYKLEKSGSTLIKILKRRTVI